MHTFQAFNFSIYASADKLVQGAGLWLGLLRSITKEIIISLQPFHCQLQLLRLASEVTPGWSLTKKVTFKVWLGGRKSAVFFCATIFGGYSNVDYEQSCTLYTAVLRLCAPKKNKWKMCFCTALGALVSKWVEETGFSQTHFAHAAPANICYGVFLQQS